MILVAFLACPLRGAGAERFQFADGDRVVFLGSTYIEREQLYGYWETYLTRANPDKSVVFRNLGWSGDTVWGEARAGFETARAGYQRLLAQTLAVKPTVIFIGYGTNESFAGKAGLARFEAQLNKLLDDLSQTKARLVLMAPPMFEEARWRSGGLDQQQRDLRMYTDAIRQMSRTRKLRFADEFCQQYGPGHPLTDNGMHLTAFGYWATAGNLLNELRMPVKEMKKVELDGLVPKEVRQDVLPNPPVPSDRREPSPRTARTANSSAPLQLVQQHGAIQADSMVIAKGLKPGKYLLRIDGQAVHSADAQTWMQPGFGAELVLRGPSLDQAERLRQAIVQKNRLFFHRWRPENETYLFGFRKYEQGQNAKEIPEFEPLVVKLEAEIATLRVPVTHKYQLVPVGEKE
jgi:lysophospholipase L1-like esterase